MTPINILLVIISFLILAWIITLLAFWSASRAWSREREKLCDRLQAGTLVDYSRHQILNQKERKPAPLDYGEVPSVEEVTALEDRLPDGVLVEARTAFNDLMDNE
jgi:hypothetical protein